MESDEQQVIRRPRRGPLVGTIGMELRMRLAYSVVRHTIPDTDLRKQPKTFVTIARLKKERKKRRKQIEGVSGKCQRGYRRDFFKWFNPREQVMYFVLLPLFPPIDRWFR